MTESARVDATVPMSATATDRRVLLRVRDLRVEYRTSGGAVRAVDDVSFDVHAGEVFGLAGESGCGKSTIAQALLRTLGPPGVITGGHVEFEGQDVLSMTDAELRDFRWRKVALVFQSAMNSLNPVMTVEEQLADVIQAHSRRAPAALRTRCEELLDLVGISAVHLGSYPHQLSGGMRQRVVIAAALALEPPLLVMDEPTTALDVVVQREILERVSALQAKLGFAILFITHDLGLMFELADTLGILYAGKLVELGPATELLRAAEHPYTRGLLASFPPLRGPKRRLEGIGGAPPNLAALPSGCRFHPRCGDRVAGCDEQVPPLVHLSRRESADSFTEHRAACLLADADADGAERLQ